MKNVFYFCCFNPKNNQNKHWDDCSFARFFVPPVGHYLYFLSVSFCIWGKTKGIWNLKLHSKRMSLFGQRMQKQQQYNCRKNSSVGDRHLMFAVWTTSQKQKNRIKNHERFIIMLGRWLWTQFWWANLIREGFLLRFKQGWIQYQYIII